MPTTDHLLLFLLLLLPGLLPAQEKSAPPVKNLRVLTMPNRLKVVVLDRPEQTLSCLATFCAAGRTSQTLAEIGLSAILATESLTGTTGEGGPGQEVEEKLQIKRQRLLLKAMKARLENRAFPERDKKDLADTTSRLESLTSPRFWLARLEKEGGCGLGTTCDATGFGLSVALPAERTGRFFALEAARLRSPALRTLLDTSQRLRLEEGRRWQREPTRRALSALLRLGIQNHPIRSWYSPPPQGPMKWSTARSFWKRAVRPGITVIAMVGPWTPELEKTCQDLFLPPGGSRPIPTNPRPEPPQEGPRFVHTLPGDPLSVNLGWRLPDKTDPAVLLVLADLLGSPKGGLLTDFHTNYLGSIKKALVKAAFPHRSTPALFVVSLIPGNGKSPTETAKTITGLLAKLAPDARETRDACDRVKSRMQIERSSPLHLAAGLAQAEATGEGAQNWLDLPRRVEAVTPNRIKKLARRLFVESRLNRVITGSAVND